MKDRLLRTLCFLMVLLLLSATAGTALAAPMPMNAPSFSLEKGLVTKVHFKKKSATVKLKPTRDGTYDIKRYVVVSPAGADNKELAWASANPAIADVSPQGIATLKGEGKVKITATSTDGSAKKASFTLTVKATRVKSLAINSSMVTLNKDATHTIISTVKPATASYGEARYVSSNTSVATVNQTSGVVTAKGAGVATITVAVDNPNKSKSIKTKKLTVRVRSNNPANFSISAVGDVILGGDRDRGTWATFKKYLNQSQQEFGNKYVRMLSKAKPYFADTDITLGNLECAVTTKSYSSALKSKYVFRSLPEYLDVIKLGGIDVLTLANNHTDDFGSSGYDNTKTNLRNRGINFNGKGYKESYIRVMDGGLRVGFIGFMTNKYITQYMVQRDIKKLKKECDVVIVSLHFADVREYTFKVTGKQKKWARSAVNSGADLVVGHHPHVLSGMENYKGVSIVYGLGSFLSVGPNPIKPRRTFIFQQTINYHNGFTEATNVRIVPFWITSSNKTNDMMPSYAPGSEAATIETMIRKYSVGEKLEFTRVPPKS